MVEAVSDPIVQRPQTDEQILARAHNHLLKNEDPMEAYVRQQWEATIGACRVALDAWRRVWPAEAADSLPETEQRKAKEIENRLSEAVHLLNGLSEEMLGVVHRALVGDLTHADLNEMGAE